MPNHSLWPELPYEEFRSTGYLLHMMMQIMGKLKLVTPFEPHWANVPLWLTSVGLTTGPIPYQDTTFSIDIDLIHHQIICVSGTGKMVRFGLADMSVETFYRLIFKALKSIDIQVSINTKPQEVPNPIPFNEDTTERTYDEYLARSWWQIVTNTYLVLQQYHAKFTGITPSIGLMWGTFDLRDARYTTQAVPTTGDNAGFLRRNAMDVAQVEAGWWSGDARYEKPAYYSFIYPQPTKIEQTKILPEKAYWNASLGEFILDYDDIRLSKNPIRDLLSFFESTYRVEAELAGWDKKLLGKGVPV